MKSKIKIVVLSLFLVATLVLVALYFIGYFNPSKAGLVIDTNPASTVFINGDQKGKSRYEETFKPGEVTVRLVPDSFDKPLMPYETKVVLVSGVKTIIQRDFAETEEKSSGAIISFEKNQTDTAEVSIVSIPDSVQVNIDGQIRGNTPFSSSAIPEGEHTISLSTERYSDKSVDVRTYKGFRLTAIFKLSPKEEEEPLTTPTPQSTSAPEVKKVVIKDTSTGFLRVRNEPSTLAEEVGRVKPGEVYKILDIDDKTKWIKIEYEDGKEGWISDAYTEETTAPLGSPVATPKSTPKS